jgi:hypothetical protein
MDMLVKLYELVAHKAQLQISKIEEKNNVTIRRAMAYEKESVVEFVRKTFTKTWTGWPSECDVAFSNWPLSCFIATFNDQRDKTNGCRVIGFACYDTTCRGFFGPTGVIKSFRRKRIGTALLLASLWAMRQEGYGYAIIGGPDKQEQWDYYSNTVGAKIIAGSENGVYQDMLEGVSH